MLIRVYVFWNLNMYDEKGFFYRIVLIATALAGQLMA